MLWRRRKQQSEGDLTASRFFRFWRWTKRVAAALAVVLALAVVSAPAITRHLLERDFCSEVSTGDHDAVRDLEYFFEDRISLARFAHGFSSLNFGDNPNTPLSGFNIE